MGRLRRAAKWAGAIGVFVLMTQALPSVSVGAADDRLPDLGMARVSDLRIEKTADGRRLLRYTSVIVNVGTGPFEMRANVGSAEPVVTQRIYDTAGGSREVALPATMILGGDGHNHWHVRDLEDSALTRLANGVKVGTGAKRGFCFFDTTAFRLSLPGAASSAVYRSAGCGNSGSTNVTMGVSVGWGDAYRYTLPDQYVDITGLGAGRYRLMVTADAADWFVESDTTDNSTWVDLQIKGSGPPASSDTGPPPEAQVPSATDPGGRKAGVIKSKPKETTIPMSKFKRGLVALGVTTVFTAGLAGPAFAGDDPKDPPAKAKCNSGRGNLSETEPANDCDPGNSGGQNQGGD